jgi:hypothetical protein
VVSTLGAKPESKCSDLRSARINLDAKEVIRQDELG